IGCINSPKEASKAIRKWLRGTTPQQQMNTISIIQGLVLGCGSKFRAQLASPEVVMELEGVLYSGYTNIYVRGRLLERLAAWSNEFSLDASMSPIINIHQKAIRSRSLVALVNPPQRQPSGPTQVTPEQRMTQILQDIELANNNAHMLVEAISFADPEVEAIEENELIKEFHSKCLTLQRGIQIYLSEVTNSTVPNETCLASLLNCNQELLAALSNYGQTMERIKKDKALKAKMTDSSNTVLRNLDQSHARQSLESIESVFEGAGVGASGFKEKLKPKYSHPLQETAYDPFNDELYRITDKSDIATAIKIGKQPVYSRDVGNSNDDESDEEKLMIKQMKEHSLMHTTKKGSSSSSVPVITV
ncbi:putative actin patch assembly and actin polymerization protein, partial [Entomortierella beljakovae]